LKSGRTRGVLDGAGRFLEQNRDYDFGEFTIHGLTPDG
jgi:hypothetical protein